MGNRDNRRKQRAKPISLHPLEPEEALAGLMQVKPEGKCASPAKDVQSENEKPQHKG